jgi:hypothetical protein
MKTALPFLAVLALVMSPGHTAVVAPPDGKENPLKAPVPPRAGAADPKPAEPASEEAPPVIEPREPLPGGAGVVDPTLTNVRDDAAFNPAPMVRVDVLMVSVPEAKALPLIPQLRDPKLMAAAEKALLEMVARKEAILEGWPEVTTHSGQRAVSESIVEQRYPIEFDVPSKAAAPDPAPAATGSKSPALAANDPATVARNISGPIPTTFETRNTGTTLEAEPVVSPDGTAVTLSTAPQLVRFERYTDFPAGTNDRGEKLSVSQPIFATSKVHIRMSLRDGERHLIHVGKATEDRARIDLFIVGVKIIPPVAGER